MHVTVTPQRVDSRVCQLLALTIRLAERFVHISKSLSIKMPAYNVEMPAYYVGV